MAGLNLWLVAAAVLAMGLIPCAVVILRDELADGLAALQLAGLIAIMVLLLLSVGFRHATVADIPMALAVLSFPSGLLFAHFLERWL